MARIERRTFFGYLGASIAMLSTKATRALGMPQQAFAPELVYTQYSPKIGFEAVFTNQAGLPFELSSPSIKVDEVTREVSFTYKIKALKHTQGLQFNVVAFDASGGVRAGQLCYDRELDVPAGDTETREIRLSNVLYVSPHGPFTRIAFAAISALENGTRWENTLGIEEQLHYMRTGTKMPHNVAYQDYTAAKLLRVQVGSCGSNSSNCSFCESIAIGSCGNKGVQSYTCSDPDPTYPIGCTCTYTCVGSPKAPPAA
jgi:hypothetical protein